MIDDAFVIDAVVHAYNNLPENRAAGRFGQAVADLLYNAHYGFSPPGYRLERASYDLDWTAEDLVNLLFLETSTDMAVHHVLPLETLWYDGHCSVEKTADIKRLAPHRIVVYAGVDPLEGPRALDELERQVEVLERPPGLKLYPMRFDEGPAGWHSVGWRMDDPKVAFPLFERAQRLGIKVVAVHKAVPLGPVPMQWFRSDDIDAAAEAFPDLTFEIVHGGLAFVEETAWQLARFPNVIVNLELVGAYLVRKPERFLEIMAGLVEVGGAGALQRIVWGSGCVAFHPEPQLEAFWRKFHFPEEMVVARGIPQITQDAKRKILADNYARVLGIDIAQAKRAIAGDTYTRRRAANGIAGPFSTTHARGAVV
jgi:predicted TIM-barrel fold metal-dependent hydrolase